MQLKKSDLAVVKTVYAGIKALYFILMQAGYLAFMAFCLPVVNTGSLYVTYTVGYIIAVGLVYWELRMLLNYQLMKLEKSQSQMQVPTAETKEKKTGERP